jgi:hypothetical protein
LKRLDDQLDAIRLILGGPIVIAVLLVCWTYWPVWFAPPKHAEPMHCPADANCVVQYRDGTECAKWQVHRQTGWECTP